MKKLIALMALAASAAFSQNTPTTGGSSTGTASIQGPTASGGAAGNPVAIGTTNAGNVIAWPGFTNGVPALGSAQTSADGVAGSLGMRMITGSVSNQLEERPFTFNGSTWDRQYTCNSFAAINVSAAATTQIVALSGTTVVHVCSLMVSTTVTGSFTLLSGTGTNCGTPANSSGALPLAANTPASFHFGSDGAYRGSTGGELCIASVGGTVTGFVMYAQY